MCVYPLSFLSISPLLPSVLKPNCIPPSNQYVTTIYIQNQPKNVFFPTNLEPSEIKPKILNNLVKGL